MFSPSSSAFKLCAMLRSLLFALTLTACATVALAQDAPQRDWGATTRQDVEAAYALLNDNHPGALPVFGDPGFRERLERARSRALEQAPILVAPVQAGLEERPDRRPGDITLLGRVEDGGERQEGPAGRPVIAPTPHRGEPAGVGPVAPESGA